MVDEILKQLQPIIATAIGLVLTWALGEAVRYLRAKITVAKADGDVAKATALEIAANAAVAAAEELARAAEKRGEPVPRGADKLELARSLMPAGIGETTAKRILTAAVARTFGTGATGTQTVGRPPASVKTGSIVALCLALGLLSGCAPIAIPALGLPLVALTSCSGAQVAWPAACAPTKSGKIVCTCKRQTIKVTRDGAGTIKTVRHYCDDAALPIDSHSQDVDTP